MNVPTARKESSMNLYPYPDLAHSYHRDSERRAAAHRLVAAATRRSDRRTDR